MTATELAVSAKPTGSTSAPRSERIALRAASSQRELLERAAAAAGKTLTAFVLDAAAAEAQRTLADRRLFLLDPDGWQRFSEALDRPVADKPRLRALLESSGPLG